MLKINSKAVKEKINKYLIDCGKNYDEKPTSNLTEIKRRIAKEFIYAMSDSEGKIRGNVQDAFIQYCRGLPSAVDCDYYLGEAESQKKIAKFLEQEPKDYEGKYTPDESCNLFSYLIFKSVQDEIYNELFREKLKKNTVEKEDFVSYEIKPELLKEKLTAIKINAKGIEKGVIQKFLANAKNDGKPLQYEIKDGYLITHLWNSEQKTPINDSYYFITKNGDTYPCEASIFEKTYNKHIQSYSYYTMKPKTIQAMKLTEKNLSNGSLDKFGKVDKENKTLTIHTLEGDQTLKCDGSLMLIKGVNGELYHNKVEKFDKQYISSLTKLAERNKADFDNMREKGDLLWIN